MFDRTKITKLIAEAFGTAVLASVVLSVSAYTSIPLFVGLAAGLSLALMVLTIGKVSGSHINPAVTLGLWSRKLIPTTDAIAYIAAQVLGASLALASYQYLADKSAELSMTAFDWRNLTGELLGTLLFGFGIAAAVYGKFTGGLQAATIGLSLMLGILVASAGSAGVLNPAVGISVGVTGWAYIVGPILGSIIGMNLYSYLFANTPAKSKKK